MVALLNRWHTALAMMALIAVMIACGLRPALAAGGTPTPMNMNMASPAPMASGQSTPIPTPEPENQNVADPKPASTVNGTTWSIFNHRGAGWFLFFWGLTALIVGMQWPRQTWFRFVPPAVLLGLAEFLFLRNDPKAWPTGQYGFWISNQDSGVFEHRLFVLLILAISIVEFLRAGGRLPRVAATWAVPVLALIGVAMILLHHHGTFEMRQIMYQMASSPEAGNMAMQRMDASMAIVKREHLIFAILGIGLAIAKFLGDAGKLPGRLAMTLWPLFAIALGGFMFFFYTE